MFSAIRGLMGWYIVLAPHYVRSAPDVMGTPMRLAEWVANAALWLASDEAAFITGVALEVDGGRCI